MKVAPISGDLVVKLAAAGAVLALVVYGLSKLKGVGNVVATDLNPASDQNLVNQGVTSIGNVLVSPTGPGRNADGSWTLGGWLYDMTHTDPLAGLNSVQAHTTITGGR